MARLIVECRTDRRQGRVPARFGWSGRMREVAEILDSWEGGDHRYFRVRGGDGGVYILRHDVLADRWRIHHFESSAGS